MSYAPNTDADRAAMLRAVGVESIDDLFVDIPIRHRDPELDLPPALPETDVIRHLGDLGARNATSSDLPSFLGAGFYRHFVPALVDQQLLRSEWYTAYTPYQPEMAQGTLQAMYEFQSLVCDLTGMEVSNASLYGRRLGAGRGRAVVPWPHAPPARRHRRHRASGLSRRSRDICQCARCRPPRRFRRPPRCN